LPDPERSRSRLEAIFSNLSDGGVIVDERGTVLGLNDAATALLQVKPVWAVGHPFILGARDRDRGQGGEGALGGTEAKTATIEDSHGGHIMEATAQLVTGSNERIGVVVLRDIT